MKVRVMCGAALLLLTLVTGIVAAQSGEETGLPGLSLVNVQSLRDLGETLGVEIRLGAVLSPDGALLAWTTSDELCVLTLESGTLTCHSLRAHELRMNGTLYWSPDSRWIALHENAFKYFIESDIWLVDVTTGDVFNLTDDGLYGNDFMNEEPVNLDMLPVWNPVNGDLYFIRHVRSPEGGVANMDLVFRIPAGETTPEQVADLTPLAGPYPIYETNTFSLEGVMAISPDGTQMAIINRPQGNDFSLFSLWVLDLTSGQVKQVANQPDVVSAGMPDWYSDSQVFEGDWFDGLAWADDQTLLVATYNAAYGSETMGPNIYRVDVTTGAATSLLDRSDVPDSASYHSEPYTAEGYPARFERQMFSVVLPGMDYVLYCSGIVTPETPVAFSALPLATGDDPVQPVRVTLIDPDDFAALLPQGPSAGSSNEIVRVLTFNYLLTFERTE